MKVGDSRIFHTFPKVETHSTFIVLDDAIVICFSMTQWLLWVLVHKESTLNHKRISTSRRKISGKQLQVFTTKT